MVDVWTQRAETLNRRKQDVQKSFNEQNLAKFNSYSPDKQNLILDILASGEDRGGSVENDWWLARPKFGGWEPYMQEYNTLGTQSKDAYRQLGSLNLNAANSSGIGGGNFRGIGAALRNQGILGQTEIGADLRKQGILSQTEIGAALRNPGILGQIENAPKATPDYNAGFGFADTIAGNQLKQGSLRSTINQYDSPKKKGGLSGALSGIFNSPIAQIAIPIVASVLAPGVGTALSSGLGLGLAAGGAGATALGAGAIGTGLGLASGQNFGQALTGGAISGGLYYGGSLLSKGLADTALGRGLSDLKAGAADTMVGRGISDIGKSASGALDSITGMAGGASSYADAVDPSGKYSFGGALDKIGGVSTAALNESTSLLSSLSPYAPTAAATAAAPSLLPPTSITESVLGAAPVAKNSANLSPLLSAGLGYVTNQSAANDLLEQQRKNAELVRGSNKAVSDALLRQYEANTALLQPYASGFEFTPGDLTADPGYQFQLTEGNRAADRANLARGNYYSGQALREAQQFGQGLADATYNSAFNRALQSRAAGLQGALSAAGVNTDYGRGTANQAINNAALLMGINENIGNVNANRTVNTNNLISGALGNLLGGSSFTNTGALQGGFDLQELLRRNRMGVSSYAS